MKKTLFTISIMAGLMMTACVKETANEQMGLPEGAMMLTTEGFQGHNTKTSVSNTSVQWVGDESEKVYLNGNEYTVGIAGGHAYVTASDAIKSGEAYGYYGVTGPSWNSTTKELTVTVPSEYTSSYADGRQVIALPMVAYKAGAADKIEFKHVTAAVKVIVKNSTANVLYLDSVMVSSDDYNLSGVITPDLDADGLGLSTASGSGEVKVKFTGNPTIAVGSTKEVQVPILPIGASDLTIKVYSHNDNIAGVPVTGLTHNFSKSAASVALGRNIMITAQINMNPVSANVVSKGTFSVSAEKAVYFSMGNLKYSRTSTSDEWTTGTWSFMTNQYDVVETGDVSTDYSEQTAIGLFGYGTSGYNNGQTCYQPWSTNVTTSNYYSSDLSGNADWGYNAIGSIPENSGWRTLSGGSTSSAEWYYLLNERTTVTSGLPSGTGSNTAARYMHATIDGTYKGMVIFPDNYTQPGDVSITGTKKYNTYSNYTATIGSVSDWEKMAAAGAIFLPTAGSRGTYSDGTKVQYPTSGYYHSSTASNGVCFSSGSPSWSVSKNKGASVRLVKNAN